MVLYECTWQRENNSERLTNAPEITLPPDTIEFSAYPLRPSSSNTNFAGGSCLW